MNETRHPTGLSFKAEQTFFEDPATDRLLAMVMTLAAELAVTKDRLATLEAVLDTSGALDRDALDRFTPSAAEKARMDADRQAFAAALMECTLGRESSLGAPEEGVEKFDRD